LHVISLDSVAKVLIESELDIDPLVEGSEERAALYFVVVFFGKEVYSEGCKSVKEDHE
jgi:hypothetical protein